MCHGEPVCRAMFLKRLNRLNVREFFQLIPYGMYNQTGLIAVLYYRILVLSFEFEGCGRGRAEVGYNQVEVLI